MNTPPSKTDRPAATWADDDGLCHAVSALMDGEATVDEWSALWDSGSDERGGSHSAWHRYHLIGDVLRASGSSTGWCATAASLSAEGSSTFARQVTRRAQAQEMLTEVPRPSQAAPTNVQTAQAANDGVFRWKMATGMAAVVAVVAVSWGVAGLDRSQGQAVLAVAPAGPVQMAKVPESQRAVAHAPVWVSTSEGHMLRDVRMQELMQTHRQLGGASALQAPAGFLRTAAMDAQQR
jgi:sigma-E factor negative regulatory protein RseA